MFKNKQMVASDNPSENLESRGKYSVLIAGFPIGTKLQIIQDYMDEISNGKTYSIIQRSNKKFRGFSFIHFTDKREAEEFCEREIRFNGKLLDYKLSVNQDDYIKDCLKELTKPRKVYVLGVPKSYSKKDIENLFMKHGDIEEISIIDKENYKCNKAFVTFIEYSSAAECAKCSVIKLDIDVEILVQFANPKFSSFMLHKTHSSIKGLIEKIKNGEKDFDPREFEILLKNLESLVENDKQTQELTKNEDENQQDTKIQNPSTPISYDKKPKHVSNPNSKAKIQKNNNLLQNNTEKKDTRQKNKFSPIPIEHPQKVVMKINYPGVTPHINPNAIVNQPEEFSFPVNPNYGNIQGQGYDANIINSSNANLQHYDAKYQQNFDYYKDYSYSYDQYYDNPVNGDIKNSSNYAYQNYNNGYYNQSHNYQHGSVCQDDYYNFSDYQSYDQSYYTRQNYSQDTAQNYDSKYYAYDQNQQQKNQSFDYFNKGENYASFTGNETQYQGDTYKDSYYKHAANNYKSYSSQNYTESKLPSQGSYFDTFTGGKEPYQNLDGGKGEVYGNQRSYHEQNYSEHYNNEGNVENREKINNQKKVENVRTQDNSLEKD